MKMNLLVLLIPILFLGFVFMARAKNPLRYKYLFRNTILSESKKHELGAVLRGRVYYPRYFYMPESKQYLVYSDVDESGSFRIHGLENKPWGKDYALLNEDGIVIEYLFTPMRFSSRSGCFYGAKAFIPLIETGKKEAVPYAKIHNEKLEFNRATFQSTFLELYALADYVEFINLREGGDDLHQAGVIFKIKGRVEILLSGLRDSHMINYFQEDLKTNNFEDYYLPDIRNKENFPQSEPCLVMVPLVTENTNSFVYWRHWFKNPIRIEKYHKEYASGWQGIMKLHGVPIYVPGDGTGTVYARFKTKNDIFRFKVLDVVKWDLFPVYNLGLRTFEVPADLRTDSSLVFIESCQNMGDNRLGGGVFVVRKSNTSNPSADIPSDMTEERFNVLPINLQEALLNPDRVQGLVIEDKNIVEWIPEIGRLKNLTHLKMETSMTEIPDEIAQFPKLKNLSMRNSEIKKISPKLALLQELEDVDLFSNKLSEFPKVVLELKNLKILDIGANDISTLPEEIAQLEQLKQLDISSTKVRILPTSMINMRKLYIHDGMDMEDTLPTEFHHLFEYTSEKE